MTLDTIDRCVAVLVGAMCAAAVVMGLGMRGDAGVFPVIAGTLGVLACAGIVLGTLRRRIPDELPSPLAWQRFTVWCLCVLGLLGLMIMAGTFVALPLFLLASLRWLGHLRWPAALAIAVAFSAVIYGVFVYLLSVPLPAGWLAG
ncbi:tripartite tricarboxylate transporter TctB family protein [Halomonas faecis]|uniref:tripartite tricarboxylate transporter TctB family protein n=1 Tax=Halomonas faecis TaxID=1562110 RepID=UPI0013D06E08|nr:tripartite tricarboxylate transporter TctB family protein [Halomonas faecis]